MLKKNCLICGSEYTKPGYLSLVNWPKKKYCSRACLDKSKVGNTYRRGKKHPNIWNKGKKTGLVPWNKGEGEYARKLGFGKWMKGKRQSIETKQKKSLRAKYLVANGSHNFWKGGVTSKNQIIRSSLEYKIWREAVFKRDDYTCVWCLARSGKGKTVVLNADHIQPFATNPELRFAIDNGRTLCKDCHIKRHRK